MMGYWTLKEALIVLELAQFLWPVRCHEREPLPVLWILPLSSPPGWGNVTAEVIPAVQLALQHLRNQPAPLGHYELELHMADSKCDNGNALKAFFDSMFYGPKHLMVFGGLCSSVTSTIARSLQAWNLTQLSFAATAPTLANRGRYPNLFRVVPSDSAVNPALLKLLDHYAWRRVGTLTQREPRFTEVQQDLTDRLVQTGVQLVDTEWFFTDPCTAIKTLKEHDVRIVIGQFDEVSAVKVFCCAHELGMFGHKYQWILSGWPQTSWWRHTGASHCSVQHVLSAMEGAISVDFETLSSRSIRGVSGKTPQEYQREYDRRCLLKGLGSSKFHGFAYDGTWVIAKALVRVMETLRYSEKYITHHNTTVTDRDITHMILQAMSETDFYGVTGRVVFRHGERVATIRFGQFHAGREMQVGEYSSISDTLEFFSPVWFKGREPTKDRTHVYPQRKQISMPHYVVFASLSVLGLITAAVLLYSSSRTPQHRVASVSGRPLTALLFLGVMLSCSCVLLYKLDVSDSLCSVRLWLVAVGHTTAFGTMLAKLGRIYAISKSSGNQKRVIEDSVLVRAVIALLLLDVCVLISVQTVDPLRRTVKEFSVEDSPDGEDFAVQPFLERCENTHMSVWLMILCVCKGPLVLLGVVLAWRTRGSDTLTGTGVCVVGPCSAIGVSAAFLTRDHPNMQFFIVALVILSCCSITLVLEFVPKLRLMRTEHEGPSLSAQIHVADREKESEMPEREKESEGDSEESERQREREGGGERRESMEQTDSSTSSSSTHVTTSSLSTLESEECRLTRRIRELDMELEELDRQLRDLSSNTVSTVEHTGGQKGQTLPLGCSVTKVDINSPDHVQRRLSLQLPILHHAYLLSVGGVDATYSPPNSPHTLYTTQYIAHRVLHTQL